MNKAAKIRKVWENTSARTLKLSRRPPADFRKGNLLPEEERYENVKKRLRHLAQVLTLLHNIYKNNKELYGDKFLAFVGNEVVREWPWKDFPFISDAAQQKINDIDPNVHVTGLMKFEIKNKQVKEVFKNFRYEHWTPISFFRDIFDLDDSLTEEDFYQILVEHYRVVWITKKEDKKLNNKNKCNRSPETYSQLGIKIHDKNFWNYLGNSG